jgi:uncharacterized flavoprotein (TIGR03862 family)
MAAEVASAAGLAVDVYESKGSVGRKLLIAGRGGLNLTHSEDFQHFLARYGSSRDAVREWLIDFDADAVRLWARSLGVDTFVGSSGRVFPLDMKAAPLLRNWVRRLRDQGVRFHVNHYCTGFASEGSLRFKTPREEKIVTYDAVVFALGGASWPQLGSDGAWVPWLRACGVEIAALEPSNCGFDVDWTEIFAKRFAGEPIKTVVVSAFDDRGAETKLQGEFVVTSTGIEGSAIYALSAQLRNAIAKHGSTEIHLDLAPQRDHESLLRELSAPRKGRSLTEHLRRTIGIEGVKAGLLYEALAKEAMNDVALVARTIKSLPLKLIRTRPIAEVISSAGGVRFAALDEWLMTKSLPGVFCAGEMIDWEAPTGGYLLTACLASGRRAAQGVVRWVASLED